MAGNGNMVGASCGILVRPDFLVGNRNRAFDWRFVAIKEGNNGRRTCNTAARTD
jgi:hypothetical protein